ncbi:unnamed protein product, partial [Didymodactylos carnosus]
MGISEEMVVSFGDSPKKLITCSVCLQVLWKPMTCEECENSYCTDCITQWLKQQQAMNRKHTCPNSNCEFKQKNKIPSLLVQLLSQLRVKCVNTINGCKELLPYEALDEHQLVCGFQQQLCQMRENGCKEIVLKKDIVTHGATCGYQRQECKGQVYGCKDIVLKKDILAHEAECGYIKQQCKGKAHGCKDLVLKKDLNTHEPQCNYIQLLCQSCETKYLRGDGHELMKCLQNQIKNLANEMQKSNANDNQQKTLIDQLKEETRLLKVNEEEQKGVNTKLLKEIRLLK